MAAQRQSRAAGIFETRRAGSARLDDESSDTPELDLFPSSWSALFCFSASRGRLVDLFIRYSLHASVRRSPARDRFDSRRVVAAPVSLRLRDFYRLGGDVAVSAQL